MCMCFYKEAVSTSKQFLPVGFRSAFLLPVVLNCYARQLVFLKCAVFVEQTLLLFVHNFQDSCLH